jgi:hypothetical protein
MQPYFKGLITNGGALTCTTAYQDIPNLTWAVAAGATYRFEAYGVWRASATTTTFNAGIGGTATLSFISFRSQVSTNNTGSGNAFVSNVAQPSVASTAASIAATDLPFILSGMVTCSASGTLTVTAKYGVLTATVQAGGRFLLEQSA